jgi:hypothetical protein
MHQSENSDSDRNQNGLDPQHCFHMEMKNREQNEAKKKKKRKTTAISFHFEVENKFVNKRK